jgi:hypothetical protein
MSGVLSSVGWFFGLVSIQMVFWLSFHSNKLGEHLSFFFLSLSNRNSGKAFAILS